MGRHFHHAKWNDDAFERFWAKVDRRAPEECWPWLASTSRGYGQYRFMGHTHNAHRVAWILTFGGIDRADDVVRHRCDDRLCCNPAHLELGSTWLNSLDAMERRRTKWGKGRGSVRERSPGVFEVQVSAGKDPATGRYRYRSRQVRGGVEDIERVRAELLAEVADIYAKPRRPTEMLPR